MKLVADRGACVGAGQCAHHAPELFAQDEDTGLVVVLKPEIAEADRAKAELAVTSCPVRAVRISE